MPSVTRISLSFHVEEKDLLTSPLAEVCISFVRALTLKCELPVPPIRASV